ncbi:C2H2-type zinc finger protein [Candidatus Dojkabacteria bacterium]|nr:C2H2-type zinc finger protein [Candidatus Dojkabacteria bacterium]
MSSNTLLNGIALVETLPVVVIKQERTPAWRWHTSCREGKIIKTDVELDKLEKEGWVSHPKNIGKQYIPPVIKPIEPVKPVLTPEMIEDARIAEKLKAESDAIKAKEDKDKLTKAALDKHATVCPLCDKAFDSAQGLRLHMTKMHRGK